MKSLLSRPVITFLLIAFGFTYVVEGWFYLAGGFEGTGPFATLYLMIAMFGPAIAALVCSLLYDKGRRGAALGLVVGKFITILKWLPYAWLVPILLAISAALMTLPLSGQNPANPIESFSNILTETGVTESDLSKIPIEALFWLQMGIGIPAGILINTIILTFSEELGWRGWLQPRLTGMGFWPMCAVIGLIWGLWHAPIILMGYNYPGMGWGGVAMMSVFCILLTPYLALLRERGAGAWGAGAFHGSVNAVTGASLMILPNPTWPWNGLLGIAGILVFAAGLALIGVYRRARPIN